MNLAWRSRAGVQAEVGLLRDVADGVYDLVAVVQADVSRAAQLVERYSDLPLAYKIRQGTDFLPA